jgi:hypothetical protein
VIGEVRVSDHVADSISALYGEECTPHGDPSESDFWSGPLAAALLIFRDFDALAFDEVSAIRRYTVVDPVFGPVVFVGVLVADGTVEIADFAIDPDYWSQFEEDDPDL